MIPTFDNSDLILVQNYHSALTNQFCKFKTIVEQLLWTSLFIFKKEAINT